MSEVVTESIPLFLVYFNKVRVYRLFILVVLLQVESL
jgi:hypothetical protein